MQLVRVSSFRNDLLQNPYFSEQGRFEKINVLGNVRDYAKGTTQTKRGIGV